MWTWGIGLCPGPEADASRALNVDSRSHQHPKIVCLLYGFIFVHFSGSGQSLSFESQRSGPG